MTVGFKQLREARSGFAFRVYMSFIPVVLLPLILASAVFYVTYRNAVSGVVKKYSYNIVANLSVNIDDQLVALTQSCNDFAYSADVQRLVMDEKLYPYENETKLTMENLDVMKGLLPFVTSDENDVRGIYIYCENGRVLYYNRSDGLFDSMTDLIEDREYKTTSWYQKARRASGQNVISRIPEEYMKNGFSISKIIRSAQDGREIGAMLMVFGDRKIRESCQDYEVHPDDNIAILDRGGTVQYLTRDADLDFVKEMLPGLDKSASQIRNSRGISYLMVSCVSPQFEWQVVRYIPFYTVMAPITWMIRMVLLLAGFLAVLSACISYVISRHVSSPLTKLCKAMEHVEAGNLHTQVVVKKNPPYEITVLYGSFNRMIRKLSELFERVATVELQNKDAQLRALQSQINPHFLYNSLSVIQMKVLIHKDYESSRMISALGNMFRYSMAQGTDTVMLEQEIAHVENYMMLQQARFPVKVYYENAVPKELYRVRSLKMVLQPLVENSFKHGEIGKKGGGRIRLWGELISGGYRVSVEDNGNGISTKQLEQINRAMEMDEDQHEERIGLGNVNRRLKTYFEKGSGVILERFHQGLRVTLTVRYKEVSGIDESSDCG